MKQTRYVAASVATTDTHTDTQNDYMHCNLVHDKILDLVQKYEQNPSLCGFY